MLSNNSYIQVEKLWAYLKMNCVLEKTDCIIVLGSHDISVAERGIQLFLEGWAPLIIFSGGFGHLTNGIWPLSEAETFGKLALERGVPESAMIIENQSSNTGENIIFSLKKLNKLGLHPESYLLVHKPYMERRTYATFKKYIDHKSFIVTSPQVSLKDYMLKEESVEVFINTLVGDLQRVEVYGRTGFQIPQSIPIDVMTAFDELVKLGYNKRLIKSDF